MGQGCWVVGRWREQAAGALQGPTWADRELCRQDCPGTYTLPEWGEEALAGEAGHFPEPPRAGGAPTSQSGRAR